MSFTRWFIYASFTGGIIALSLQPSGIANAAQSSIILVADQSSTTTQDAQRDSRSGKKGTSDAETSGKMQSDKNPASGNMDPNTRMDGQSTREQSGGASQGSKRQESNPGGSTGSSSMPSGSGSMSGSGTSSGGTAGGSR